MEPTADDVDALKELINIGVGRAAGMLHDITGCVISLKVPSIQIVEFAQLSGGNGGEKDPVLSISAARCPV